ncbi:conserved hypothetical protein [Vibrio coralliirubri]|uniref:restriction endonuclease subunit S n=1 Tax=Vibrio coralliirubri TaxID=1516159 RepID=UPI00063A6DEC|nr:restriction endonuclease subunit S [Vibrio coralliirubri]CDT86990.1 conserved hypothetical protein [Vibrio coralliirubri]
MTGCYRVYPEYIKSEVDWIGDIPEHWRVKRLKFIFDIKKRIAGQLGFDVLSITQKGIVVKDTESGDGQLSMDYSKYQRVFDGDFAMNHMDLLTGYVDISSFDGVTSPDYRVFSLTDISTYYARYYLYLLQMCYKQKIFFPLGQGSAHLGRWRLPTEAFNEVEYPHPNFAEQQIIANFLDHETAKIDTLIAKQEKLIELLKEKRQAVISHVVTKGLNPDATMKDSGVGWLGEVPEHWVVSPLKHHCQLIDGDRSSAYPNDKDLVDDGIPFVSSKNIVDFRFTNKKLNFITQEKFNQLSRGKLVSGDLVITVRGTIGHVAIFDSRLLGYSTGFINAQMMIIRLKSLSSDFLMYVCESNSWKEQMSIGSYGSTVKQLSNQVVGNALIAIPPIGELEKTLNYLNEKTQKISNLMCRAVKGVDLMKERKSALISAAVTGKIDVRDWAVLYKDQG